MVFGRPLSDYISCIPYAADWFISQELRKRMMAKSQEVDGEKLARNTMNLRALQIGTPVVLQNGRYPTKWDKTGVVVDVRPHEQIVVMVRNRRFVRELDPRKTRLEDQPYNNDLPLPPVTC